MPPEVLVFVIIIVVLGGITFVKAMNEPTDARFPNSRPIDMRRPDYGQNKLTEFGKMLSCAKAINTVNGRQVLFSVYVTKDGIYEPQVEARLRTKAKSEEREWFDIDFILDGYLLATSEPFQAATYGDHYISYDNRRAVGAIYEYEQRKEQGLEYHGRKSKVKSYEYKVTCDRS